MFKKKLTFSRPCLSKKVFWIFLLSFVLVPALTFGQTFPGKTWEKIENPEKYGFSSQKLKQMDEILKSMDTASFLVIKDGKILYEYGDREQKCFTHSARKSFMSTLYGIYVENGAIDLNKSMADLGIDDDPPLSETEKKATILNCLMAKSGVYHDSAAQSHQWTPSNQNAIHINRDFGYVQQQREEMEVLFTLMNYRYERGSIIITSNLPFSKWEVIFKDPMTTAAAIDRLVHHSVILEMNIPSYRIEEANKGGNRKGVRLGSA